MIVVALAALIALPMVKIEKDYVFGGPNGKRPLQLKLIGTENFGNGVILLRYCSQS